jgi:acetyltransferase-like isoleucine patch superfamily enzyme
MSSFLPHDWFPEPLPRNIETGPRSWIYSSFAFRHYRSEQPCGLRIGSDTGIYDGTMFDLGATGRVEIGDYCTVVSAIFATEGEVIIGDYTFVAHDVVFADTPVAVPPGALATPGDRVDDARIVVGRNAWIAMRAILLAGAHIGDNAIIGAAAVVDMPVPDNAIVAGNPARIVGWAAAGSDPTVRLGG